MYITLHDLSFSLRYLLCCKDKFKRLFEIRIITYFKTQSRYFLRKSNLTNSETLDNQYHKQFEDALSM